MLEEHETIENWQRRGLMKFIKVSMLSNKLFYSH